MTSSQARRLETHAHAKKLAVVVLDQPETLLDAVSRSILVAALRSVSLVSVAGLETWRHTHFGCETTAYDESADRRATAEFVDLIARRMQ